jgi:hypothetical protein
VAKLTSCSGRAATSDNTTHELLVGFAWQNRSTIASVWATSYPHSTITGAGILQEVTRISSGMMVADKEPEKFG